MMARNVHMCFFCGSPILHTKVPIETQDVVEGGVAPIKIEYAHPECARMLEEEDEDEEALEDE